MLLMVEAMKARVGNSGRKLVLVKLADNANDEGVCWPSYKNIAEHCEMGRSTVKAHIKRLEQDGFLTVEERNDGKSSNMFRLHISEGSKQERAISTRSKFDPVNSQPGQNLDQTRSESDPEPGQDLTPEPVIKPIKESPITPGPEKNSSHCPHAKIIEIYHECLPSLPRVLIDRWVGSTRAKHLTSRWKESPKHQTLDFWRMYFTLVNHFPHQMGVNDRGWKATLEWLVKRDNFDRMLERMANLESAA
jgi:DNA-binding MarR family transcriptional regulator